VKNLLKIYIKLLKTIIYTGFALGLGLIIISCTKDVPKELLEDPNQRKKQQDISKQQMPDDSIHRNLSGKNNSENTEADVKGDPKAEQMVKQADDADAKYMKTKSEADKKICIVKQLTAANYLMFEANLSPKKKYRPALQRYRRVLELDPGNTEAAENKKQIEDIYQSMGMPIPD
jgi:hypothetical protein